MALKFHYNKTTIQEFKRQLAIREKALPILKNKETALRLKVEKLMRELDEVEIQFKKLGQKMGIFNAFWNEFPEIFRIDDVEIFQKRVIGVRVPEIGPVKFKIADVSWWNLPTWIPSGIELMQEVIKIDLKKDILQKQIKLLDLARKKTTQKVNLYEKVQIPDYESAILKIKRFLEDKENISKAAQKIMKNRKDRRAA